MGIIMLGAETAGTLPPENIEAGMRTGKGIPNCCSACSTHLHRRSLSPILHTAATRSSERQTDRQTERGWSRQACQHRHS